MNGPLGWVGATTALFVAAIVGMVVKSEGESTAYILGGILGRVAIALLVGALLRWIYVRFISREGEVRSPWLVVIAAIFATLAAGGAIAQEGGGGNDDPQACATPARTAAQLTRGMSRGFTSAEAPEESLDMLRDRMPSDLDPSEITGRAVLRDKERVGVVAVWESNEPLDEEDFFAGMEEGAGSKGRSVPLGGESGRLFTGRDGGGVVGGASDTCAVVFVFAVSPSDAAAVAAALKL